MPFIVSWPGKIPANSLDTTSVITAYDLTKTFAGLAGAKPDQTGAGMDVLNVFLGKQKATDRKIFWEYGRNDTAFAYPKGKDRSPTLAIREGRWKLLMNADKSGAELYDIVADRNEVSNVAGANPAVAERLVAELAAWRKKLDRK